MLLRFVRWWVILLGGILLGAGLCLHGQLAVAEHLRDQVQDTFFLWRGIGQVTFIFQDEVTQAALWMNEIPEEVVEESSSAAWTLCILGGLLACTAPLLRRPRRRKAGKPKRKPARAAAA